MLEGASKELGTDLEYQNVVELVNTILFYKFPQMTRQEIEAMFELSDLRQTRVYQEALEEGEVKGKLEGKLETVPLLLRTGLGVDQIARELGLDVEAVRKASRMDVDG